jgi:antitoxin component of MazEF toxin-antitoxin module
MIYEYEEIFSEDPDNPENLILTWPDEVIEQVGWEVGQVIDIKVENNCIIFSKKS